MRANDFITEQPVTTTNPQGVTTTVNKAANKVTTKSDMGTVVKDRTGGVRSIQTPRIGGTQFKQTFRPDATPGYQQANFKSGGIELDAKGSPETGFTQSAAYSGGGVNAKQTQRYSGQTQSDLSTSMGKNKVSARQTVSKPGAKPVNQMSITKGGKTTVYNDINEAFEEIIAAEAREIDPKKMQAYMDFKKENNVDGSSVRMAVDNPDHPETKRMMKNKDFVKAVSMYKSAIKSQANEHTVNEDWIRANDQGEITLEDTQDFHEEFGHLGYSIDENDLFEAEYQGRKVKLNKPMRGDVKKFKVYVKNKKGNVIKVNFGHGGTSAKKAGEKTMSIRKSNPAARKSFRARHNCANPGPKTKARYWSCRKW